MPIPGTDRTIRTTETAPPAYVYSVNTGNEYVDTYGDVEYTVDDEDNPVHSGTCPAVASLGNRPVACSSEDTG